MQRRASRPGTVAAPETETTADETKAAPNGAEAAAPPTETKEVAAVAAPAADQSSPMMREFRKNLSVYVVFNLATCATQKLLQTGICYR